jgi:ubiquinone biosynthesis protein UbiJ
MSQPDLAKVAKQVDALEKAFDKLTDRVERLAKVENEWEHLQIELTNEVDAELAKSVGKQDKRLGDLMKQVAQLKKEVADLKKNASATR